MKFDRCLPRRSTPKCIITPPVISALTANLGRCPQCKGDGVLQIDMQFLADIVMTCPDCRGKRYRPEILRVQYRHQSIADVLAMTIREAQSFFRGAAKVQQKLKVLGDVGLEYLQLGQSATTLSSGEAQRLKLAAYLSSGLAEEDSVRARRAHDGIAYQRHRATLGLFRCIARGRQFADCRGA